MDGDCGIIGAEFIVGTETGFVQTIACWVGDKLQGGTGLHLTAGSGIGVSIIAVVETGVVIDTVASDVFNTCGEVGVDAVLAVGVFTDATDCLLNRPIRFTCPD